MSSEKPFWEGKTCKEMAGLHVKATWKNGTIVTGVLDDTGDIELCDNRSLYTSRSYDSSCDFEPIDNIQSIELLDDTKYDRIDNIEDVREGDVFVANDGNKYLIDNVDTNRAFEWCRPYLSYAPAFRLSNVAFAYALRPKPKLPDHDGLWLDKGDGLWLVTGTTVIEIAPKDPPAASISYPASSREAAERLSLFAPFRPAKVVEA